MYCHIITRVQKAHESHYLNIDFRSFGKWLKQLYTLLFMQQMNNNYLVIGSFVCVHILCNPDDPFFGVRDTSAL